MKIVSVDPGISTGVAIKLNNSYVTITLTVDDIETGVLWDYIKDAQQVVIEHFTVFYAKSRGKVSGYGLDTIETVGRVMGYCETLKVPLARQHPQNRKAFMKQAKQLASPGHTRHEVDALAHLLAWEYKRRNNDELR